MNYWLERFADALEWLILYTGNTIKRMKADLSCLLHQTLGIIIAIILWALFAIRNPKKFANTIICLFHDSSTGD